MSGALFVLVNLLMLLAAWGIAVRFPRDRGLAERVLATVLVYVSQIALTSLFLGLIVADLSPLPLLAINALLALLIIGWRRRDLRPALGEAVCRLKRFAREELSWRRPAALLLLTLFLLQTGLLLVKIYYLPPDVGDVYSYHLHPVADWVQQKRISSEIESPVTRVNRNAYTPKLLHLWTMMAGGDDRWLEWPQFLFGLLVPLAVFALSRRIGVSGSMAWRIALLAYFTPLVLVESRTCQDHLILHSATLMALLYLIDAVFDERRESIVFLGLALGWILGSKISGMQVIVVLAAALALSLGFRAPRRALLKRGRRGPLALGVSLAALLGLYWYVKDAAIYRLYLDKLVLFMSSHRLRLLAIAAALLLLLFLRRGLAEAARRMIDCGKRFATNRKRTAIIMLTVLVVAAVAAWPERRLLNDFLLSRRAPASQLNERVFLEAHPLLKKLRGPLLKNVMFFPFRIRDIGNFSLYTPDLQEQSGFGVAFIAFALPAYLLAAVALRRRSFRRGRAGFLTLASFSLLLSYFIYYYSASNYRLFTFFPLLGLVLWGPWAERIAARTGRRRLLDALVLLMVLWNGLVCLCEGNMNWRGWKTTLTVADPLQRTPAKFSLLLTDKAWQFLDRYAAPQEPIAYAGHYDSPVFPYFDNQLRRPIFHLPALPGFQLERTGPRQVRLLLTPQLIDSLRRRSIHFIHLNAYGAHHLTSESDRIAVDDPHVIRLTRDLYFFDG
jgi:hypothetical protein